MSGEKVYSVEDMQNIIKNEQEQWDRISRKVIKVMHIDKDGRTKQMRIGLIRHTSAGLILDVYWE